MKLNNINHNLESIFSDNLTPFAIIHRPTVDNNTVDIFTGTITTHNILDDLPFDTNCKYPLK